MVSASITACRSLPWVTAQTFLYDRVLLYAEINLFLPKLLFGHSVYHTNRKPTTAISNFPIVTPWKSCGNFNLFQSVALFTRSNYIFLIISFSRYSGPIYWLQELMNKCGQPSDEHCLSQLSSHLSAVFTCIFSIAIAFPPGAMWSLPSPPHFCHATANKTKPIFSVQGLIHIPHHWSFQPS